MKKRLSVTIVIILTLVFMLSTACSGRNGSNGLSAYELAVKYGFTGTEEQWLASLKGEPGRDAQVIDIDIYDLYEAYLESHPTATFEQFLEQYMVVGYNDTEYAVSKAIPSAVSVYSTFDVRGFGGMTSEERAAGSGVIYRIDGDDVYIITNYHVVYEKTSTSANKIAKTIEVYTYGFQTQQNEVSAEFVGGSISKDIALLKAKKSDFKTQIQAVTIADSNEISLGQKVITIGNPLAEGFAVSSGVVSVDSEDIEMEALDNAANVVSMRVIRTDAAVNGGNSGGGMFNLRGELVGIVNAKSIQDEVDNVGYAIPSNVALGIVEAVRTNDSKKCLLGIMVMSTPRQTIFDTATNTVQIIEKMTLDSFVGELCKDALAVGDVITKVSLNDGAEFTLTRNFHLPDFLYKVRPGDTINLTVLRNDQPLTVQLTPSATDFATI